MKFHNISSFFFFKRELIFCIESQLTHKDKTKYDSIKYYLLSLEINQKDLHRNTTINAKQFTICQRFKLQIFLKNTLELILEDRHNYSLQFQTTNCELNVDADAIYREKIECVHCVKK